MTTWGIVPAVGEARRRGQLPFSKELLPVGTRAHGTTERPRAVVEYVLDRMRLASVDRYCVVISGDKSDIVSYLGVELGLSPVSYVVQPKPLGFCDAMFRALPFIAPEDSVIVGLPNTIWFPENGLTHLEDGGLSFLCFPAVQPDPFDSVVFNEEGEVLAIDVESAAPQSPWTWGAFKLDGAILRDLFDLYRVRGGEDEHFGTLVSAWIARGGRATAVRLGEVYVDVGTMDGYRTALDLLAARS